MMSGTVLVALMRNFFVNNSRYREGDNGYINRLLKNIMLTKINKKNVWAIIAENSIQKQIMVTI